MADMCIDLALGRQSQSRDAVYRWDELLRGVDGADRASETARPGQGRDANAAGLENAVGISQQAESS